MNTQNIIIDGESYRLVKNRRDFEPKDKFKVTEGRYKDREYTVDLVLLNGVVANENLVSFSFEQIEKI